MAEENKEIIFSLKFDTDEALRRAGYLKEAIEADKESLAALNKEIQKNGAATRDEAKKREELEHNIRLNTKARGDEVSNSIDANGKYNGSINQLRSALSVMTQQWNNLTREERENAQVGGVLQAETKKLSDQLKNLEGSVGDNRRSVGGYLDAIRQAPGAMGKMRAGLDGIGMAMKATPLGLLVSLLPQIAAMFNTSGEGADFFAKAMTIVNAVIQEGVKRLVALAGAAVKMFSGDFKGAFADGKAAVSGFGDAIVKVVGEGGKLADMIDTLENAESRFTVTSAENRKVIQDLLIQSKARTTSEADRIKLLERAEKLEIENNRQAIKLAKDRLKVVQEENRQNAKDQDEELKREDEAKVRIIELEANSSAILERIQVRKDALEQARAEKAKKREEDAAKRREKEREEAQKAAEIEAQRLADLEKKRLSILEEARIFRDDMASLDKKETDEKLERDAFLLSVDIDNARLRTKTEKEQADKRKAIKEAEFQSFKTLTAAGQEVFALLAEENSDFIVFQKALAGLQIAIDSAKAISKLTASAGEVAAEVAAVSGPAGVVTGPLAYAAYYGTQIAVLAANFAKAKQLLTGEAPKYKAAEGGLLSGPSHAIGGIQGTGRFANVEVEGGEAIINKRSTALFAPILSAINQLGGGRALMPTNYAAGGGFLPSAVTNTAFKVDSAPALDYNALAKAVAKQPIYVIPTEIRNKANAADSRKVRAGLGYR
jgi:hypothetical protein